MPSYRLRCVMRFTDGREGNPSDDIVIEAKTPEEAIAVARGIDTAAGNMTLGAAILTDAAGTVIGG